MYFSDEESTSSQEQDLIQAQRSRSPSLFDIDHDADNDADADEDEDLEPMPPAPIQHGGKTLRLNAATSDSSSDDDDDDQLQMAVAEEDDNDDDDDDDNEDEEEVAAEVQVSVPRGKVLRIPPQNDQDDTDEEDEEEAQTADVMVMDTSMDVDADADIEVEVEAEAELDDMSDDAAVATATPIKGDEFGEVAVAVAAEEDGEAVAAIVMDGNDSDISEVAAVAEVVVPKKVRKKPGPKPKKKEKRGSTSTGSKKSSGGGKRRKRSDTDDEVHSSLVKTSGSTIARDKLEAAQKARDILLTSTKTTPFHVSDSHIIRNFGRIKVESKGGNPRFSTTTSLFPVGFSCDRFEFSPVHGRGLKMRCEILDGKDYAHGDADVKTKKEGNSTKARDKLNAKSPLFRITWGQGIDELDNGKPFPFDVYSAAAPLGNNVDSVAVPMGLDVPIVPETDMRVKVRFDDDVWYRGTITRVTKKTASDVKEKKKRGTRSAKTKNKNHFSLKLLYDDGMKEEVIYPDPDIVLVAPGE